MNYASPNFAILGILALLMWSLAFYKIFKKPELQIPIYRSVRNWSRGLFRNAIFILGVIAWLSISYGLARPREVLNFKPRTIEVNDIFIVLDISQSMLAQDYLPNRLEAAKTKVAEFVALKPADRLGVIIFSEKAFTFLPLTTDLQLVKALLKDVRVGQLGSGTAIGDAIGLAVARAEKSEANNKVIILLTDGVNNVGTLDPINASELAREKNIKIYTIAIGRDENATLDGHNPIPGGSIDLPTLRTIAAKTNGKSYFAGDDLALEDCLKEISELERTKIESESQIVYRELYFEYILFGVILLCFVEIGRRAVLREAV